MDTPPLSVVHDDLIELLSGILGAYALASGRKVGFILILSDGAACESGGGFPGLQTVPERRKWELALLAEVTRRAEKTA